MKIAFDKVLVDCDLLGEDPTPRGNRVLRFRDPGGLPLKDFLRNPDVPPKPGTILQVLYDKDTLLVGELWGYKDGEFTFRAWPTMSGDNKPCTGSNANLKGT